MQAILDESVGRPRIHCHGLSPRGAGVRHHDHLRDDVLPVCLQVPIVREGKVESIIDLVENSSGAEVDAAIRRLCLASKIAPVLCGSVD